MRHVPTLRYVEATPARWRDVDVLFGPRGASAGCWCMWWRLPRSVWRRGKGAGNRRALRRLVESGARPGVLAYAGREPVGWCAVAPREEYPVLERSRILQPVDERPVWSITCLFVARSWRRRGVSTGLLKAAAAFARRRGARIVEGYPTDAGGKRAADAFVFTGLEPGFRRAGFVEVARRSRSRPIMRRVVRGARDSGMVRAR
jgi:GNAT superfamily N-acetyltransferase